MNESMDESGDYDDRTPLHLAACNGNTAVLEYLLKQETVLVNAVDRFGGTPWDDAMRHGRKGAAALLEEAGCVRRLHTDHKESNIHKAAITRTLTASIQSSSSLTSKRSVTAVPPSLEAKPTKTSLLKQKEEEERQRQREAEEEEERRKREAKEMIKQKAAEKVAQEAAEAILKDMILRSNQKKEERLAAERKPKIQHLLANSQEMKMVSTISDKLSKARR